MTTETTLTTMVPTVQYKAIKPNQIINIEARKIYTEAYNDALKNGSIPRDKLNEHLIKKGILDQSDLTKIEDLQNKINKLLEPLNKGGIKLSSMIDQAKEAGALRTELFDARTKINKYEYLTAESVAEDARIMYYIWNCFRNLDGSLVWKTFEDFKKSDNVDLQETAARMVDDMLYPDSEFDIIKAFAGLPEYEFLIKHKVLNEKLEDLKLDTSDPVFLDDDGNPLKNTA